MTTEHHKPAVTDPIKPLFIAFACEPERGSEPGIGWNSVYHASRERPVWVITEAVRRDKIDAYLTRTGDQNINVIYHRLPQWCQWMWKSALTLNLYYYVWHKQVEKIARQLHAKQQFDVVHHVSYVRYWMPSAAASLNIPFIWGPVGGGESFPPGFLKGSGWSERLTESIRVAMRWCFERDPRLQRCASRATIGIACSTETAQRMKRLGISDLRLMSCIGMSPGTVNNDTPQRTADGKVRFISVGRLLYWKGFHLGLRAFAEANIPNAEYVIVGDGPHMNKLKRLASKLNITSSVSFTGALPWREGLKEFQKADVLVHPSLHDSGGFVLLEAMEMCKPVICLDIGGPGLHVNRDTGFAIPATSVSQVSTDLADAMKKLAADQALRERLGNEGRRRAVTEFSWSSKAEAFEQMYEHLLQRK
jgi:glycosyltransferase involved in cell wall biosynthesis